jgi:hypothetical protein
MAKYEHCQFAKILIIMLCFGIVLCLVVAGVLRESAGITLSVAAIRGACALLFSSLTIEVTDQHLRWRFGPGRIRKQVSLVDIGHAEVTRTRVIEGRGIHLTSRGWLYNVSGFQAVEIHLKRGKRFLLGSDEPEKLVMALGERTNAK